MNDGLTKEQLGWLIKQLERLENEAYEPTCFAYQRALKFIDTAKGLASGPCGYCSGSGIRPIK